ncbi:MAG: hypothetical protein HY293_05475 [Planctomycetes bacterium]|nr:hypothetical protein [Planctomycetota bacterium]
MILQVATALLLQVQDPGLSAPPVFDPEDQGEKDKEKPPQGPANFEVAGNRISLYGIIRMDAYYGTGNFNHTQFTYFALSPEPTFTPATNDRRNWIDYTPRLSRLGVKIDRDTLPFWEGAKVNGVIEFDFQNRATSEVSGLESESRELPRLRHAYIKVTSGGFSLLAGQTWDLISPLWPVVNADGMMWNSGNLGDRRPQFRFGYDAPISDEAAFTAALALARTGAIDRKNQDAAAASDNMRDGDASGRPMVQGRLGLAKLLGKRLDAGVWGHFGWERTDTAIAGRVHFYSASVGADLKVKILDELTFSGEVWYGKNLSDVRGGIDQGVNANGVEIAARGGWAELLAQLATPYAVAGGVSVDDPRDSSLTVATQRSHNIAPYLYNRYDFGGGLTMGAEAIFWTTDYKGILSGRANRYSIFFTYSF